MRPFFTLLFALLSLPVIAQVQNQAGAVKSVYIPLKVYRETGKALTAKDSSQFMFHKNDTLVKMPADYDIAEHTEGIRVPYEPKDPGFLAVYKNTVFNDDVKVHRQKPTLKIWKEDVRVYFEPTVPRTHQKELMDMASQLSLEIDSLNIKRVKNRGKANFLIYYLTNEHDFDFDPRINNDRKGYYLSWNGRQQIERAALKIDTRLLFNENDQIENLKSTFFRALGMFYPTRLVPHNSLLSYNAIGKELTPVDMEILKYHYSFGICKGTTLEVFEHTHDAYQLMLNENPNSKLDIIHSYEYFK